MAIVTLDGVISGARPVQPLSFTVPTLIAAQSCWSSWGTAQLAGGTGTWNNTTATGALSSSSANVAGQVAPHYDPAAGKNSYLARFTAQAPQVCTLLLCDRLVAYGYNDGGTTALLASATAPTFAGMPAIPSRDQNGAALGAGVFMGLELAAASAVTPSTPTLVATYTDSILGGSTASSAILDTMNLASAPKGTFYRMPLAAGGGGVKTVASYALSATLGAGAASLVLYRVLATLPIPSANVPYSVDALTGGFPQLMNGVVPFILMFPTTTTGGLIVGSYQETQG
jgi:hypothetical protein